MTKLNEIIESIQKFQASQAALATCLVDLETRVSGQQLNESNYKNEGRLGNDHGFGRGNNE